MEVSVLTAEPVPCPGASHISTRTPGHRSLQKVLELSDFFSNSGPVFARQAWHH